MGNVYKGAHTGEFVVVSCRMALRVVRGKDTDGMDSCVGVGCACQAKDVLFVSASESEAEVFWRSGNVGADTLELSR